MPPPKSPPRALIEPAWITAPIAVQNAAAWKELAAQHEATGLAQAPHAPVPVAAQNAWNSTVDEIKRDVRATRLRKAHREAMEQRDLAQEQERLEQIEKRRQERAEEKAAAERAKREEQEAREREREAARRAREGAERDFTANLDAGESMDGFNNDLGGFLDGEEGGFDGGGSFL
jgi:hypothetical protein